MPSRKPKITWCGVYRGDRPGQVRLSVNGSAHLVDWVEALHMARLCVGQVWYQLLCGDTPSGDLREVLSTLALVNEQSTWTREAVLKLLGEAAPSTALDELKGLHYPVNYINRQKCCVICTEPNGKPSIWPTKTDQLIYGGNTDV